MGFWHTGYMEFHEEVGLGDFVPQPTTYRCPNCDFECESGFELRTHQFEEHPSARPRLFVRGTEIGYTTHTVVHPLLVDDVLADSCSSARVNGQKVPVDSLGDVLASLWQGPAEVVLFGDQDEARFLIDFKVADEQELAMVDQCFEKLARGKILNIQAIEAFISETQQLSTTAQYVDGICDYLYGILAKEGSGESYLTFKEYSERFNRSTERLGQFRRNVSDVICGLVAFNFNQFKRANWGMNECRYLDLTSELPTVSFPLWRAERQSIYSMTD